MSSSSSRAKSQRIGDAVDLKGKAGYVRLPDGSVVTAAGSYEFRHVGDHVVIVDSEETTYKVADPNAGAAES